MYYKQAGPAGRCSVSSSVKHDLAGLTNRKLTTSKSSTRMAEITA